MKKPQTQRILEALQDGSWHCTNEFYADFMADPRRRMVDLRGKGYELESRVCRTHTNHDGGSKEWRLVEVKKPEPKPVYVLINGKRELVTNL